MKRNYYIDFLRGGVIFLMLWGHCIQYCSPQSIDFFQNICYKFIYSFHMPLFMIISGYLFKKTMEINQDKIKKKISSIIQPLILGNIINYYLSLVINYETINLKSFFGGQWLNGMIGLWYLWALLVAVIASYISFKVIKNTILQLILIVILGVFNLFVPNVNACLYVYPFFVLGFISDNILGKIYEYKKILTLISGIGFFLMLM